jgi:hypothetical protein
MLTFTVDGGVSTLDVTEGTVQKMDFKLIARNDLLVGRCLSVRDKPGFESTEPHIVTLSRSERKTPASERGKS